MKNAAGREIPDAILERYKKTGYAGAYARDQQTYQKAAPAVRGFVRPGQSKLTGSIREALERCGIRDGMVLSFHHHFRDGDYVVNMVMEEVAAMGIRDITICASSLGAAHNPVADMIEQGIVTGIQSSGVRGRIGEAISHGKLKNPAIIRSHGGRVRAIEEGNVHIDIAFIGAPTSDEYGNAGVQAEKATAVFCPTLWQMRNMQTKWWLLRTALFLRQTSHPAFPWLM